MTNTQPYFTDSRALAIKAAGEYIKSGGYAAYPETHKHGYRVVTSERNGVRKFLSDNRARQLLKAEY